MKLNIIDTIEEWNTIGNEWNNLLRTSIQNVPFLTHEFQQAWWKHKGGGEWPVATLFIVIAKDDTGKIIGIAPLMKSKNDAGLQSIMFIGNLEIADFLDVIVASENHHLFLKDLINLISTRNDWDNLVFNNLLDESPTLSSLKTIANDLNLIYKTNVLQPAPRIKLPNTIEEYFENLDKKYRHEIKRKMRNAAKHFIPIKYVSVGESDNLSNEMDEFELLMRNEERKNIFLTESMPAQMKSIAEAAYKNGWLNLKFLYVGKDKATGFFSFSYNNQLYLYNSGMSNKYGNLSPGLVFMGHLIMESIENGVEYFDFMRGDEEYKYHLGGENRYVHQAIIRKQN
jgi:CelD/BcsL family acetyltransferase involved in cellulose biosynthesis